MDTPSTTLSCMGSGAGSRRNTRPADPWSARFSFFWYNDREIFRASQAELDRQARELAAAGIDHVITFSCTHFRWSFRRHWPLLTEVLGRVVEACHRNGIAVTEHHSSHLTFNPHPDGPAHEEDVRYVERILTVRGSSLASWPHLLEDARDDPLIDGVPLSSLRQIDGRTGRWARSNYRGWCMCFNNPDYRRAYLKYLETLYVQGIDGIMTDDVQWFGQGHACACRHCRRLFSERTGYELPSPGAAWEQWYGNYDDPSFVAWLDFRLRSIEDFHAAVKAHYESLGLRPLRPNYVSGALNRNPTAYALETLPDLDWVFQECCYSTIIRYSWPGWALEAAHRHAVGRRRNIPSMSMFYPDRWDTLLFTWGLAMSWGGLYLATPEGVSLGGQEARLRSFEQRHARLLQAPRKVARLGFYDSRRNRELYGLAEQRSLRALKTWMQACYRSSVPFDLFQREELDRLGGYDVVVLNEVALLDEEEWARFGDFVRAGGTLVWTGATGTRDENGTLRSPEYVSRRWELPPTESAGQWTEPGIHATGGGPQADTGAHVAGAREQAQAVPQTAGANPPQAEIPIHAAGADPHQAKVTVHAVGAEPHQAKVTAYAVGAGRLVVVPGEWGLGPMEGVLGADRWQADQIRVPFQGLSAADRTARKAIVDLLVGLLPGGADLAVTHLPEDVVATVFQSRDGNSLVVHLVNAAGILEVEPGGDAGHRDPIPFPRHEAAVPATLRIRKPRGTEGRRARAAWYRDPEEETETSGEGRAGSRSGDTVGLGLGERAARQSGDATHLGLGDRSGSPPDNQPGPEPSDSPGQRPSEHARREFDDRPDAHPDDRTEPEWDDRSVPGPGGADPDDGNGVRLPVTDTGQAVQVQVPLSLIRGYGLVEIALE